MAPASSRAIAWQLTAAIWLPVSTLERRVPYGLTEATFSPLAALILEVLRYISIQCTPPVASSFRYFLSAVAISSAPTLRFDGETWWKHVQRLAADDMESRYTDSEGLNRAQAYVISQLKQAGLIPAGSQGFTQPSLDGVPPN